MTKPRYQDVKGSDIPEVIDDDGSRARIICGEFWGKTGPIEGVAADPRYLDIFVPAGQTKHLPVETTRHAFAYVFDGSGSFRDSSSDLVANRTLVLFDRGDEVVVHAGDRGVRFLLVSGKPLEEPVAWRGPIVMNTKQELQVAFDELQRGTFIK
jgi:redox-sensitive bicupin YhaK (pirin superfamily)